MREVELCVAVDVSMYFHISSKTHAETDLVFLNCNQIEDVEHVKFLGICFDKKLTWDFHTQRVCNEVSSGIFLHRKW